MNFKSFKEFILEKKADKDIQDVVPPKPDLDPSVPLTCPKCGKTSSPCDCYIDDYYNSKYPQQAPKPTKIIKPKKKDE